MRAWFAQEMAQDPGRICRKVEDVLYQLYPHQVAAIIQQESSQHKTTTNQTPCKKKG